MVVSFLFKHAIYRTLILRYRVYKQN